MIYENEAAERIEHDGNRAAEAFVGNLKLSLKEADKAIRDGITAMKPVDPSQTAKADAGKPILTLVPPAAIRAIERVRAYGNKKYHDPDNWRTVEAQRHWEAVLRHTLAAWWDFEAKDAESGLMHIDHIMCDLSFLEQMIEEDSDE